MSRHWKSDFVRCNGRNDVDPMSVLACKMYEYYYSKLTCFRTFLSSVIDVAVWHDNVTADIVVPRIQVAKWWSDSLRRQSVFADVGRSVATSCKLPFILYSFHHVPTTIKQLLSLPLPRRTFTLIYFVFLGSDFLPAAVICQVKSILLSFFSLLYFSS